jgi:hypothetical protein
VRGRAASDSRFPTKRQKPPYTSGRGRTLILIGIVAFALLVFLGARAGGDAGRTVSYHGERYERAAVATQEHVDSAGVAATGEKVDGQEVFAEDRTPSRVLFLLRADGEYDAFVLVDEP